MSIAIFNTEKNEWEIIASLLATSIKVADINGYFKSKNVEGIFEEIARTNSNKVTRVEVDGDYIKFFSDTKLIDSVFIPMTSEMKNIIGELSALMTDDKTSLVSATNELAEKLRLFGLVLDEYNNRINRIKGVHVGTEQPTSQDVVWIDRNVEDFDLTMGTNDTLLQSFRTQLKKLTKKIEDISHSINYEINAGKIVPTELPPTETRTGEDYVPEIDDGSKGNVKRIRIKRGLKSELLEYIIHDGEMVLCEDTSEVYIGVRGLPKRIGNSNDSGGGSGGNVTAEYIDLISPNGTKYRVTITDAGKLFIYEASIDDAEPPKPSDADRFKGLLVNHVYGGGARNCGGTPVTHGFIELYNNTENPINLKGFSLQYGEYGRPWEVLKLKGIIPPYCAFLVRCARHSEDTDKAVRLRVRESDMDWDIPLVDIGKKILLYIGTESVNIVNPANADGFGNPVEGYIDMIGAGGSDVTRLIDGYETRYGQWFDKFTSVHRKDFKDSVTTTNKVGDNRVDCEPLDFRYCDVDIYGPRCTTDGFWDIYYDKPKLDQNKPEMLSIFFGPNGDTDRNFSWQSVPTNTGYLQYRKRGDVDYITVNSNRRHVQHRDGDATVHTVEITGLTPGIYEYRAGEDGKWSDYFTFEVKTYDENSTMTILHTTDQQGWDAHEYQSWGHASRYIMDNEEYDWRINTGDISQNGGRSFEWRFYYEHAKEDLRTKVEMTCAGNNDLIAPDKNDSTAFTYYSHYSNQPYPSVFRYDVGLCTFITLHAWAQNDIVVEDFVNKQVAWFDEELAKPRRRWTIVIMHVAPYTVVEMNQPKPYLPIMEKHKVDLVLCGHNHCYSRSKPVYNKQVDPVNGIYHIMSQATGFKLSGKEGPAAEPLWYYGHAETPRQPAYNMYEITNDYIRFKAFKINGLQFTDPSTKLVYYGDPKDFAKEMFDSGEIPHRSLR